MKARVHFVGGRGCGNRPASQTMNTLNWDHVTCKACLKVKSKMDICRADDRLAMKLDTEMRVLTVLEPWASLIASGRKPWENRGQREAVFARDLRGSWLAIHAGALMKPDPRHDALMAPDGKSWPGAGELWRRLPSPLTGNLVALAKVGRVLLPEAGPRSPWRVKGQWGIELLEVHRLDPLIPCQGAQGWRYLQRIDGGRPYYQLEEQVAGWSS